MLCRCNATYCDTITRIRPNFGSFQVYTTTNNGKRFEKSSGAITRIADNLEQGSFFNTSVIRLFSNRRYQYINGFGGSVTDAASINWRKLSDDAQTNFVNSYFSEKGLEYSLIRVPIAGSDFSTHPYTYNETPWGDRRLTNYSLTLEDYLYKIPLIKRAMRASPGEILITASTWSPPVWMKTNERITGFSLLRPLYYTSYANYHLKFLEEYDKADIKIWAITTTNEPLNGIVPIAQFNSLGWTPQTHARWIANHLGPVIRNSQFNSTKILAIDDQRYILRIWMLGMEAENHQALDYIDGIAVHYYGNFAPASILDDIQRRYPSKFILSTEACEGAMPWHLEKVELGSWRRARRYTQNILQDLNHFVTGWIDWNLCLDPNGGPNWANNFVDSPILVYEDDTFFKQPMFYAMGHFSKFIPRGSQRIHVLRRSIPTIDQLAVITPEGNYVLVLHNGQRSNFRVRIQLDETREVIVDMEPESIKTIEINPNTQ